MKQDEFGDILGMNRQMISRLESGNQLVDQKIIKKFWDKLKICPRWLIIGDDVGNLSDKDQEINQLKELLAAKTEIIQLLKDAAGKIN